MIKEVYPQLKKKYGIDTVKLFNQPIAEEGVLEYQEKGKIIRKAKKWEDLKANIGRIVPIVDEHPDEKNGKGGLLNDEKVYGMAKIKKCPNANKLLCGDPVLDDKSPVKKGYSIGFVFDPDNTPGKLNDQPYDQVQSGLLIDHIALTNHPRSGHAIQVAGDTIDISGCNMAINKLSLDYDTFRFSSNIISKDQGESKKMPKRFDEIKEKLKSDNPEMDEEELTKRANQIVKNEEDQEEEEKEKKEKDSLLIQMDKQEMIAKLSRLEAEVDSQKQYKKTISKLESEKDSLRVASDKYKSELKRLLTSQVQVNIDRLKSVYSFDSKEFDKKSPDFIAGALYASDRIKEGVSVNRSKSSDSISASNPDGTIDINNFRYNFDTGKMEELK